MANRQQTTQLDQSQKIRLGIWGPPSSGKTVYMTMLAHYLTVAKSSPWKVEITDPGTRKFVGDNIELITEKGQFMDPTPAVRGKSPAVYSYKLVHKNGVKKDVELNFFDLAGEFYLGREQYKISDGSGQELTIPQYLNQCHGILFLLSPLDEDKPPLKGSSYYSLLRKLFMSMQSERRNSESPELEQYVAFCITKVDHPEVYEKFCRSTAAKSLLELLGSNASLDWFQNFFHVEINTRKQELIPEPNEYNRCQFFYVSPFGVFRDEAENITKSPVSSLESMEDKPAPHNILQNTDPVFQNPNLKVNQYERNVPTSGIESYDNWEETGDRKLKSYQVNTGITFSPINVISPIQWLIKGIENHPPDLSPLEAIVEEEA